MVMTIYLESSEEMKKIPYPQLKEAVIMDSTLTPSATCFMNQQGHQPTSSAKSQNESNKKPKFNDLKTTIHT